MSEVIITKLEQEIAGILNSGGDITANLITLLKAKQTEIDQAERLGYENRINVEIFRDRVNELDAYLNENWEDLDGHNEDIAGIFKLEVEQETEVSFTITGTATIKHPRGTDLEDMDMSELIDCDIVTRDYTYEVQDYEVETITGN
jgi:hypothetical protein